MIFFIIWFWIQKLVGEIVPRPVSQHTCDSAPHCRKTLQAYDETWRPKHITRDIADRVPIDKLQEMQRQLPLVTDRKEAQRMKFDSIKVLAGQFFDSLRASPVESVCDLHCDDGEHCDLYGPLSCDDGEHCDLYGPLSCPTDEDEHRPLNYGDCNALTLNASGVVCKNVSRIGSRSGDTGSGALSQILWTAERRAMQEDMVMIECTEDFDPAGIQYEMDASHNCCSAVLKAHYSGDAYNRTRKSSMLCHRERTVVVEDIEAALSRSMRSVDMPWPELWLQDDALQCAELEMIAADPRRSRALPVDKSDLSWEDTLLPSQLTRKASYNDVFGSPLSVYDLDHDPKKRPRKVCDDKISTRGVRTLSGDPVQLFPCLISHFSMWNPNLQRPLCLHEALGLHGLPTQGCEFQNMFPVDILSLVQQKIVTYNEGKSMTGNGWHLPTQGLWLVLWLSSIELRHDLTKLPPELAPGGVVDIDSDDDVPDVGSPWKAPKRALEPVSTPRRGLRRFESSELSPLDEDDDYVLRGRSTWVQRHANHGYQTGRVPLVLDESCTETDIEEPLDDQRPDVDSI